MPRVVSAGVPMRTPLVIHGLWRSPGTAFFVDRDPDPVQRILGQLSGEGPRRRAEGAAQVEQQQ